MKKKTKFFIGLLLVIISTITNLLYYYCTSWGLPVWRCNISGVLAGFSPFETLGMQGKGFEHKFTGITTDD